MAAMGSTMATTANTENTNFSKLFLWRIVKRLIAGKEL